VWTDTHCHVPWEGVGEDVLDEARAAGVTRFVTIGTTVGTSRAAIDVAGRHDDVWATVGVHPHDAAAADLAEVERLLAGERVVAVGECGLDFHYDHSPRDVQLEVFAAHVRLAQRYDLALVVHTREAWDATFEVLDAEGLPPRTVFHCFTGGPAEAARALERGGVLSFSGIVTFKNADDVRAAAALCPLDRLVVETDSPYLAPVPHRGRANRPAWLPAVGEAVAAAKGLDPADLAAATTDNARRLFRLG
jgi:TatD DNase family protein